MTTSVEWPIELLYLVDIIIGNRCSPDLSEPGSN